MEKVSWQSTFRENRVNRDKTGLYTENSPDPTLCLQGGREFSVLAGWRVLLTIFFFFFLGCEIQFSWESLRWSSLPVNSYILKSWDWVCRQQFPFLLNPELHLEVFPKAWCCSQAWGSWVQSLMEVFTEIQILSGLWPIRRVGDPLCQAWKRRPPATLGLGLPASSWLLVWAAPRGQADAQWSSSW